MALNGAPVERIAELRPLVYLAVPSWPICHGESVCGMNGGRNYPPVASSLAVVLYGNETSRVDLPHRRKRPVEFDIEPKSRDWSEPTDMTCVNRLCFMGGAIGRTSQLIENFLTPQRPSKPLPAPVGLGRHAGPCGSHRHYSRNSFDCFPGRNR
jgi:hypothetical protein